MAYNEKLAASVRSALEHLSHVEERKMFRGVTFMVNGKMCICVGYDEIMCRIDPEIQQDLIKQTGCRVKVMNGREYKGYVLVGGDELNTKKKLDYWIELALDFNTRAKASPKRKKKVTG